MLTEDKAITLGHPSYVWRFGQDRRLNLVRRYVPLEGKAILDIGCGLGAYMTKFRQFSERVHGIEIERERAVEGGRRGVPHIAIARGENLPYKDGVFDIVFLHEVLEHVQDDAQTVREALRVLRPGGHVVIFVPNRLYFFETHGFYLGKKYIFRLLPLVNWLPDVIRNRLVPHARAYLARDLRRLFQGQPARVVVHTYVYPGYDNIVARRPILGNLLRRTTYFAERTPLKVFGLSHFLVVEKVG
ncbi:MAG: methyltransferase domain-containing protein [Chloroflexi bacterium]|nr:methyltransferase domain-containing protein [Chloroflexota bacterium]